MSQAEQTLSRQAPLAHWELIAFIVLMPGIGALGLDMMLPALNEMASDLSAPRPNDQQFIVATYLFGFGAGQIIYGPLSDAFGRRPVILASIAAFIVTTIVCMLTSDFQLMLVARLLQGATAAAGRVIAIAIARDLTSGRTMAEVMSLSMAIFMAVPILAPSIGQLVLSFAPWRGTFALLLITQLILLIWITMRLPETLHPENRISLSLKSSTAAFREAMTTRLTLGYTLAGTAFFAGLYAFLNSAQQIFTEVFELGDNFPLAFAIIAGGMAVTSYLNSRLVQSLGQRKLSHTALLTFIGISSLHAVILAAGAHNLYLFIGLLSCSTALLGLIAANFSALAMEPVGHIAGTASAAYGFVTGIVATLIGALIGQMYDGTAIPLVAGQAALSTLALVAVWVTERGQLFGSGEH